MPEKLTFYLEGPPPVSPYEAAAGLRALVYAWLDRADPVMAETLHALNTPKPFALSPLWVPEGVRVGESGSGLAGWKVGRLKVSAPVESDRERVGGTPSELEGWKVERWKVSAPSEPEGVRGARDGEALEGSLGSANLPTHSGTACKPANFPTRTGAVAQTDAACGGIVCFEVSVLADWALAALREGLPEPGERIRLGKREYMLAGWNENRGCEWRSLAAARPLRVVTLRMLSPTAHHAPTRHRKSIVLPQPELYFGSWLHRWNLYAPEELRLPEELLEVVDQHVAVGHCAGRTERVTLDGNRVFVGFVGEVRFVVVASEKVPPGALAALGSLARFAEYCGTGVETMRGMGQTWAV